MDAINALVSDSWAIGSTTNVAGIANFMMLAMNIVISLAGLFGVGLGVFRVVADLICIATPEGVQAIHKLKLEGAKQLQVGGDASTLARATGVISQILSHFPDVLSISSYSADGDNKPNRTPIAQASIQQWLTHDFITMVIIVVALLVVYAGYTTKFYLSAANVTTYALDRVLENANPEQLVNELTGAVGAYVVASNDEAVNTATHQAASAIFTAFPDINNEARQGIVGEIEGFYVAGSFDKAKDGTKEFKIGVESYVTKTGIDKNTVAAANDASKLNFTNGTKTSYQMIYQHELKDIKGLKSLKFESNWGGKGYLITTVTYTQKATYKYVP